MSDRLAQACIFVIGCSALFSWNAVITISDYWRARFCGSVFARSYESAFSAAYQCAARRGNGTPDLLERQDASGTALMANLMALRAAKSSSVRARVVPTTRALALVFVAFAALAVWPQAPRDAVFAPLTFLGVGLCGWLSQFLCAACYGAAAAMGGGFNAANMAGQGLAGVVPALIVVVTYLSEGSGSDDDGDDGGCAALRVDAGAVGYFVAAAALYVVSLRAFDVLERSEAFRTAGLHEAPETPDELRAGLIAATTSPLGAESLEDAEGDLEPASPEPKPARKTLPELAWTARTPAAAVFMVFAVTLAPFPALTALARPQGHADDDGEGGGLFRLLFVPLLFLEFNVFDFLGRSSGGWVKAPAPGVLRNIAVLRAGFIPLFALGTLAGQRGYGPLGASEAPFLVMAPFAYSNGLTATLAMAAAPALVEAPDRELVGNLMSLALTLGLATGSLLSFGLVYLTA